ncbi:MAG: hypothetical protein Q9187_007486, partial [Circinaria calcarea]
RWQVPHTPPKPQSGTMLIQTIEDAKPTAFLPVRRALYSGQSDSANKRVNLFTFDAKLPSEGSIERHLDGDEGNMQPGWNGLERTKVKKRDDEPEEAASWSLGRYIKKDSAITRAVITLRRIPSYLLTLCIWTSACDHSLSLKAKANAHFRPLQKLISSLCVSSRVGPMRS